MNQYIDEGYLKDNNLLLIKYKSKIKNLRANIKLLIRGKLSLINFKKEIEDFHLLENLLNLNSSSNIKFGDIKFKSRDKSLVKL